MTRSHPEAASQVLPSRKTNPGHSERRLKGRPNADGTSRLSLTATHFSIHGHPTFETHGFYCRRCRGEDPRDAPRKFASLWRHTGLGA